MVKAEHNQNEIGEIPEGWELHNILDIAQIVDGDRGANYPSKADLKDDGYCLFLNAGNVTKLGFKFDSCEFISEERDGLLSKGKLIRGDIVLTTRGSIGNFSYYDDAVPYNQIRINSGMVVLRIFSKKVDRIYLYFLLRSSFVRKQIDKLSFGSAQPQLTVNGISTLKLPLPTDEAEQRAIADALTDVDTLIASLEKLIEKKRDIKSATMQQLLTGKKRLANFGGEWTPVSIGRHAYLKARIGWQALTTNEYLEFGDYQLVTGTDFKNGRIDWAGCWYVSEWRYSQDKNIQLMNGDVLITKDGTIGKVGYVEDLSIPATLNSGVFVIRPMNNSFHPMYLYYVLSSRIFRDFLDENLRFPFWVRFGVTF